MIQSQENFVLQVRLARGSFQKQLRNDIMFLKNNEKANVKLLLITPDKIILFI